MGYLVRMLEKQKWDRVLTKGLTHSGTPADTITSDLKTFSNTLSLWYIEKEIDLSDAVVALAMSRNRITRLDVMIFEIDDFENNNLEIKNTPENGNCPIESFNTQHFDLIDLNYQKLGEVSKLIIEKLPDTTKCIRYEKSKIKELLYLSYSKQSFKLDEINDTLKEDFIKVLATKEAG